MREPEKIVGVNNTRLGQQDTSKNSTALASTYWIDKLASRWTG